MLRRGAEVAVSIGPEKPRADVVAKVLRRLQMHIIKKGQEVLKQFVLLPRQDSEDWLVVALADTLSKSGINPGEEDEELGEQAGDLLQALIDSIRKHPGLKKFANRHGSKKEISKAAVDTFAERMVEIFALNADIRERIQNFLKAQPVSECAKLEENIITGNTVKRNTKPKPAENEPSSAFLKQAKHADVPQPQKAPTVDAPTANVVAHADPLPPPVHAPVEAESIPVVSVSLKEAVPIVRDYGTIQCRLEAIVEVQACLAQPELYPTEADACRHVGITSMQYAEWSASREAMKQAASEGRTYMPRIPRFRLEKASLPAVESAMSVPVEKVQESVLEHANHSAFAPSNGDTAPLSLPQKKKPANFRTPKQKLEDLAAVDTLLKTLHGHRALWNACKAVGINRKQYGQWKKQQTRLQEAARQNMMQLPRGRCSPIPTGDAGLENSEALQSITSGEDAFLNPFEVAVDPVIPALQNGHKRKVRDDATEDLQEWELPPATKQEIPFMNTKKNPTVIPPVDTTKEVVPRVPWAVGDIVDYCDREIVLRVTNVDRDGQNRSRVQAQITQWTSNRYLRDLDNAYARDEALTLTFVRESPLSVLWSMDPEQNVVMAGLKIRNFNGKKTLEFRT